MDIDSCCEKCCIDLLSDEDMIRSKYMMNSRYTSRFMKKQFILDYLHSHFSGNQVNFFVGGLKICRRAWLVVHELSENLYRKAFRLKTQGIINIILLLIIIIS